MWDGNSGDYADVDEDTCISLGGVGVICVFVYIIFYYDRYKCALYRNQNLSKTPIN